MKRGQLLLAVLAALAVGASAEGMAAAFDSGG